MYSKNFKYAVIGGLFGMSSANIYAASSEAASECDRMNQVAPEKHLFTVKRYERVVSQDPNEKRYKRRRRRFVVSQDYWTPKPPSGGASMPVPPREELGIHPHSYNLAA